MKRISEVTLFLVALAFGSVYGECDKCNSNNPVACHSETVYSLCLNDQPTMNFVTCPTDYICTSDVFVCYPRNSSVASCTNSTDDGSSQCGICASRGNLYACLNQTTIAFCFGDDVPHYESLSYCPAGTVCDLNAESGFCTAATKSAPSCRQSQWTTSTPAVTTSTLSSTTTTSTTTPTVPTTTSPVATITTTPVSTTTTTSVPTTTPVPTTTTTPVSTTTTTPVLTTTTTPVSTTTITPVPMTTTTLDSTTTTEHVLTPEEICENHDASGTIAYPGDLTCKVSIQCSETNKVWKAVVNTCPANQWFDPTLKFCTTTYTCLTQSTSTKTSTPDPNTTNLPTTTPTPTILVPNTTTTLNPTTTTEHVLTPEEICENYGASDTIAYPGDLTCKVSIQCSETNNVWKAVVNTCPANQWFNPTLKFCSTTHTCPVQSTSTTSDPSTARTLTLEEICEEHGVVETIAAPDDNTCRKYIVCSKPGANWIAQEYTCRSYFNPTTKRCSSTYVCPT
ncbi:integumentary mucin C.1 [Bactrocera oleae]|uniref:integumentary mucin C.1 n=1 Tax=Bactrocera oleae TaxID=104688 RepID=UPI0006B7E8B6|nr:integumentary mucin C.1-like [Bactrocera oleae]